MKTEEVKRCCAVCEYLGDKPNCPLYQVYKDSETMGNDVFEETGQYKMLCDEFKINSKLVDIPDIPKESNNINIENIRDTIKHYVNLYVEDVKREDDTPESLDFWVDEIIKNIH